MLNDLTKEEITELNDLLEQLKQIEQLSEKSRKEKIMGEIVAIFDLACIIWISFILYFWHKKK